jgi:hypothetical protein
MVSGVADCLMAFANLCDVLAMWDLMELAGQLEIAVETIRSANGAWVRVHVSRGAYLRTAGWLQMTIRLVIVPSWTPK